MLSNSAKLAVFTMACMLGAHAVNAQPVQTVEFASASTPPTPFQIKRAKAQGKTIGPKPGDPLKGYLRLPDGAGPFPAVVLLHGCEGIKPFQNDWAAFLTDKGYATLVVDSFSTRGQDHPMCDRVNSDRRSKLVSGRVFDAFGALQFLNEQPNINANRVAALAWTRETGISLVNQDSASRFFEERFGAAVQFYPECFSTSAGGKFFAPLLVLYPSENDWSVERDCAALATNSTGVNPDFRIYEGAYHGFDDPDFTGGLSKDDWQNIYKTPPKSVTVRYNPHLAERARGEIVEFLSKSLGN